MAHVDAATYYHVWAPVPAEGFPIPPWQVGATLAVGVDENNFTRKFENSHLVRMNGQPQRWLGRIRTWLVNEQSRQQAGQGVSQPHFGEAFNCLRAASLILHRHGMFRRELLFEEVRAASFPTLPSRRSCCFLSSYPWVEYWWNAVDGPAQPGSRIYQVSATGEVHVGFNGWLDDDTISHDDLRANAGEYWRGVASSTTPEEEVLFQGKLEVQDEYLNLADFQGRATP